MSADAVNLIVRGDGWPVSAVFPDTGETVALDDCPEFAALREEVQRTAVDPTLGVLVDQVREQPGYGAAVTALTDAILARFRPRPPRRRRPAALPNAFPGGLGAVPSSPPIRAVFAAFDDAAEGALRWSADPATGAPAFRHSEKGGSTTVSLRPDDDERSSDAEITERLWQQVRTLDDLDADVLLAALAQHLASKDAEGGTWLYASTVLDYRGIKPKMADGRRRGHRVADLEDIARRFERLSAVWLDVARMVLVPQPGRRRAPKREELVFESRLLSIEERVSQREFGGGSVPVAWYYRPGRWAREFLAEGGRRHVASLLQQTLRYDPYRQQPEKRLGRYYAFHHRIAGGRAVTRHIGDLLEELCIPVDEGHPQRTRARLHAALDRLATDHVIGGWEGDTDADHAKRPARGWLPVWRAATVTAWPPPAAARAVETP